MGTGTLTWPSAGKPSPFWTAIGDWLRSTASATDSRQASGGSPGKPLAPGSHHVPGTPRRAAKTQPFREVATRSLGRSASEPLPVFIPEGAAELSAWLALPRDRQALLAAIAARLDAESQGHLRILLSGGLLARCDQVGEGDLLSHLAKLYTEPMGPGCDQSALLEAAIRAIALPHTARSAVWIGWLAHRAPAELARLVTGLASARAFVRLASGARLSRSAQWFMSPGDLLGRLLGSADLHKG